MVQVTSGGIKVNTDGAFDPKSGEGGWGFVIRDDQGTVMLAGSGKENYLQDAFHAELLGCLACLRDAMDMGLQNIVLETDASIVKTTLDSDEYRLSAMRFHY